jgi:hypothetical protein
MNSHESPKPSSKILKNLMAHVENDLRIRPITVSSKLLGCHVLASLITLNFCGQFGMKLSFFGSFDLMPYFMGSGLLACQIFCGAFYLGLSFLLSALCLPRHEFMWLRRNVVLVSAAFTFSSGIFLAVMGDAHAPLYLVAWGLGAFLAACLSVVLLKGVQDFLWHAPFRR